jgi:hypothetical protein
MRRHQFTGHFPSKKQLLLHPTDAGAVTINQQSQMLPCAAAMIQNF